MILNYNPCNLERLITNSYIMYGVVKDHISEYLTAIK